MEKEKTEDFVYISRVAFDAMKINEDFALNTKESISIMRNKEALCKLIQLKAFSIQNQIWSWEFEKWAEVWYELVKALNNVADEITQIESIFKKPENEMQDI